MSDKFEADIIWFNQGEKPIGLNIPKAIQDGTNMAKYSTIPDLDDFIPHKGKKPTDYHELQDQRRDWIETHAREWEEINKRR